MTSIALTNHVSSLCALISREHAYQDPYGLQVVDGAKRVGRIRGRSEWLIRPEWMLGGERGKNKIGGRGRCKEIDGERSIGRRRCESKSRIGGGDRLDTDIGIL